MTQDVTFKIGYSLLVSNNTDGINFVDKVLNYLFVEKNLEGRKATKFNFNPFVLFCLCLENTFGWLVIFSAVMEGVIEIAKSEENGFD